MSENPTHEDLARQVRLINWPGEGLVVEIDTDFGSKMFTLSGLQWRVMELEKHGQEARLEQTALRMLSSALETTLGDSEYGGTSDGG